MGFKVVYFKNFHPLRLFHSFKTVHTSPLKITAIKQVSSIIWLIMFFAMQMTRMSTLLEIASFSLVSKRKSFEIIMSIFPSSSQNFILLYLSSHLTNSKAEYILKKNSVLTTFHENSMSKKGELKLMLSRRKRQNCFLLHTTVWYQLAGQIVWTQLPVT